MSHPVITHLVELPTRHVFPVGFSPKVALPWVDVSELFDERMRWCTAAFYTPVQVEKTTRAILRKFLVGKHIFYKEATRMHPPRLVVSLPALPTFWTQIQPFVRVDEKPELRLLHAGILACPIASMIQTQHFLWPEREPYEAFDGIVECGGGDDEAHVACTLSQPLAARARARLLERVHTVHIDDGAGTARALASRHGCEVCLSHTPLIKLDALCQSARDDMGPPAPRAPVELVPFASAWPDFDAADIERIVDGVNTVEIEVRPIDGGVAAERAVAQKAEVAAKLAVIHERGGVLELVGKGIVTKGAAKLAAVLANNTTVTALDLNLNSLGNPGCVPLATTLAHSRTLTALNLSENAIGDAGAQTLAGALAHNAVVRSLVLTRNVIGDAGTCALAEAFGDNATLTAWDMSSNRLAAGSAAAIGVLLERRSCNLTMLNLLDNQLGVDGALALAPALAHTPTLATLYLGSNALACDGATAIAEALKFNRSVKVLRLGANAIGDEGAAALAMAMQYNSTLRILDLAYNSFGDAGGAAIGASLLMNATLETVDLDFGKFGAGGVVALVAAMQVNLHVCQLVLGSASARDAGLALMAQLRSAIMRNQQRRRDCDREHNRHVARALLEQAQE